MFCIQRHRNFFAIHYMIKRSVRFNKKDRPFYTKRAVLFLKQEEDKLCRYVLFLKIYNLIINNLIFRLSQAHLQFCAYKAFSCFHEPDLNIYVGQTQRAELQILRVQKQSYLNGCLSRY